jgi:hypothetical protein
MDQLRRLREQFTPEQAEALMDAIEGRAVSRDYFDAQLGLLRKDFDAQLGLLRKDVDAQLGLLRKDVDGQLGLLRRDVETQIALLRTEVDARLEAMEKRLILWGISLAGLIVTLTTLFERLIR